jgi:toxin ParE1/3/4
VARRLGARSPQAGPEAAVRVRWTTPALADVEAHHDYLAAFNPAAARRVAGALRSAGDTLARFPHRGRPGREPGTRELAAVRPYVVVYAVEADEVRILRVWHAAQDR